MTRLRLVAYSRLAKVAEAKGFDWVRASGSHIVFRHSSGKIIVIPDHGAQVMVDTSADDSGLEFKTKEGKGKKEKEEEKSKK